MTYNINQYKIIKAVIVKEWCIIKRMLALMVHMLNEGHQDYIQSLYNNYKALIYSAAMERLNNHSDAEDVVQNVMIKIINHISSFEGHSNNEIKSLISVYARNAANDYYRMKKRRRCHEAPIEIISNEDSEEIAGDIHDVEINIEDIAVNNEMVETVRRLLLKLSQQDQDIIFLRLIQEQPSKTIADMLNITVNAVDLRYKKAKERLLRLLGDELK